MLVSNENKYVFLSNEIAKHPDIQQWTPEELLAKESGFNFWDELREHLDCLRICDACNRPMIEGYCIDDGRSIIVQMIAYISIIPKKNISR